VKLRREGKEGLTKENFVSQYRETAASAADLPEYTRLAGHRVSGSVSARPPDTMLIALRPLSIQYLKLLTLALRTKVRDQPHLADRPIGFEYSRSRIQGLVDTTSITGLLRMPQVCSPLFHHDGSVADRQYLLGQHR
jgi:hypothetical protein